MPKVKETQSAFNRRMVDNHPRIFRCDGSVLFCLLCDTVVSANQLFQVKQHLKTAKHIESAERKSQGGSNSSQSLMTTFQQDIDTNRSSSVFAMDLTKCFLEANIPLHKISHPAVVKFVEKYTKYAPPSENTLRLKYLPIMYAECIARLKKSEQTITFGFQLMKRQTASNDMSLISFLVFWAWSTSKVGLICLLQQFYNRRTNPRSLHSSMIH